MHIPKPIYKMRRHKRPVIAFLIFLIPLVFLYSIEPVSAETYSITPAAPGRIREGESIALTLSVAGGTSFTQYFFTLNVTQPDFTVHGGTLLLTTDGAGAASGPINYPFQFSSANTNFVGTYNIIVNQITPTGATNPVATGSFTVGLTDRTEYQRTNTVLIQAAGYGNRENVTVDIAQGGTHAIGFPHVVMASTSGLVTDTWYIPPDSRSGSWTVSVAGSTTFKSPTDQHSITVNAATLLVTVTTDQSSYARTQTITAYATVRYPDGTVLNSTYPPNTFALVRVTFVNGSVLRVMSWNATSQLWYASYTVPAGINPSTLPQTWNIQVTANDQEPFPPSNTGTGQTSVTIQLVPSNPDLQITVLDSSSAPLANVFLNITFTNGTAVTYGYTDSEGMSSFTLATAYNYYVVARLDGYNDYLDSFYLSGNLMKRTYYLTATPYTGTILSGSYTTLAHYNPGESGTLVIWIYNENSTYPITITKIEIQFPWFATYGTGYIGNASVTGLPHEIAPKTNWNTTVSFTVPNDGRIYAGSGGQIYIHATAQAWKNAWNITSTGTPVAWRTLTLTTIDPRTGSYAGQGFVTADNIVVSIPTQDSGASGQLTIIEALLALFLVNIAFLALIWLRLKPLSKMGALPKV